MLTKFDKNVNIYLYFKERSDKNDENLEWKQKLNTKVITNVKFICIIAYL